MMDSIGAGSSREQAQRAGLYVERLNALSADRDLRAEEAVRAQERFNLALEGPTCRALLASEDRRKRAGNGDRGDPVHPAPHHRRTRRPPAARPCEARSMALAEQSGSGNSTNSAASAMCDTLAILTTPLGQRSARARPDGSRRRKGAPTRRR
jgi:hypothetical protein